MCSTLKKNRNNAQYVKRKMYGVKVFQLKVGDHILRTNHKEIVCIKNVFIICGCVMYLLAQHPADEKVHDRTQDHFCISSTDQRFG